MLNFLLIYGKFLRYTLRYAKINKQLKPVGCHLKHGDTNVNFMLFLNLFLVF